MVIATVLTVATPTTAARPVEPAQLNKLTIHITQPPKLQGSLHPVQMTEIVQATYTPKVSVPPAAVSSGGDIETIVRQAARKYGIDENNFVRIARCESGLNPNSINHSYYENGNPSGLFQHISGYWPARAAKYGWSGASVFNAQANAEVTAQMFRDGLQHLWECR